MGRFGWHSGTCIAKEYTYESQGYPDYGLDQNNLTNVAKGNIRLTHDVGFLVGSGVPTDGASGTGAGNLGPGSLYIDYTNKNHYINANTKASPTWKLVTRAA